MDHLSEPLSYRVWRDLPDQRRDLSHEYNVPNLVSSFAIYFEQHVEMYTRNTEDTEFCNLKYAYFYFPELF